MLVRNARPETNQCQVARIQTAGRRTFRGVHSHERAVEHSWRQAGSGKGSLYSGFAFVHDTKEAIDPIVNKIPTIQYRFQKGGGYGKPMTVPNEDMERFIHAVNVSENPRYYLPCELLPAMCGRNICIVGGPLDGYEGKLLTVRGSKTKRLLVELPNFFSVGVEVCPEYIKLL